MPVPVGTFRRASGPPCNTGRSFQYTAACLDVPHKSCKLLEIVSQLRSDPGKRFVDIYSSAGSWAESYEGNYGLLSHQNKLWANPALLLSRTKQIPSQRDFSNNPICRGTRKEHTTFPNFNLTKI